MANRGPFREQPPTWPALYEVLLTRPRAGGHLFRKMNYLKYHANKLREQIDPAARRAADLDEIERLQERRWRSRTRSSAPTSAWSSRSPSGTSAPRTTSSSWSRDGNMSLDPRRGEVRLRPRQQVQHLRHLGDHEELRPRRSPRRTTAATGSSPATRRCSRPPPTPGSTSTSQESAQRRNQEAVKEMLGQLDDRERRDHRRPLRDQRRPASRPLEQLGREPGSAKDACGRSESRARDARKIARGEARPADALGATGGLRDHRSLCGRVLGAPRNILRCFAPTSTCRGDGFRTLRWRPSAPAGPRHSRRIAERSRCGEPRQGRGTYLGRPHAGRFSRSPAQKRLAMDVATVYLEISRTVWSRA